MKSFNIYVQALSSVAQKVTANPMIFSACEAEGITANDWQELTDCGSLAQSADLQQSATRQRLFVSQKALDAQQALVSLNIDNIKIRKKAVYRDLFQSGASAEDLLFVTQLSFAVRAPTREASTEKRRPSESAAPDAKVLQLSRMANEISQRPAVAKAFAARGISDAVLRQLQDLPLQVAEAQARRDSDYAAWLEAGAWERAGVTQQRQLWAQMRRGVIRVSKRMPAVKALLDYLRDAKERSKTGQKLGPRSPKPASTTELSRTA